MTLEIGRLAPLFEAPAAPVTAAPAPPQPATGPHAAPDARHPGDTLFDDIPPAPTPEVRAQVDRAQERIQELHAQNRTLHFTKDEGSNRVVIEVRDLDGNVIRTIPPSKALDVMAGEKL